MTFLPTLKQLQYLTALQTDELCPCNWSEGQDTLKPAA